MNFILSLCDNTLRDLAKTTRTCGYKSGSTRPRMNP